MGLKWFEKQEKEKFYPLVALTSSVVFPRKHLEVILSDKINRLAIDRAMEEDYRVVAVFGKGFENHGTSPVIGAEAEVISKRSLASGSYRVNLLGKRRVIVKDLIREGDLFYAMVFPVEDDYDVGVEEKALIINIIEALREYADLRDRDLPAILRSPPDSPEEMSFLIDSIPDFVGFPPERAYELLAELSLKKRIKLAFELVEKELVVLRLSRKIKEDVKKQIEKNQKEYYLNEQLKVIQKELGHFESFKEEIVQLETRIKEKDLPENVRAIALKELKKLSSMQPTSAEAAVVRNYLDWILALPWRERTRDRLNLDRAHKILDRDHYGLEKVKDRIIEYLAVKKLNRKFKGNILCFVGPPGVGKTSLARSIAESLGRKFVRISLGGVKDEAEIRGHRRTYVGALPGKIIQGMRKAGSVNPVFLMDEVDKLSSDFRGDPASALLEVLDPEQNNAFMDHYLDIEYDLSDVFFITTANYLPSIPPPLRDRMEIISIEGYTEHEKVEIAFRHLIPKQKKLHGLSRIKIEFTREAVVRIINEYTREAGVRNLEREIASIMRKIAREVATTRKPRSSIEIVVDVEAVERYLGIPRFKNIGNEKVTMPGVVNGLAWTEYGGVLLIIETTIIPGTGKLTLTGKLGEVMKESSQAALTYVRSISDILGLEEDFYQKYDIHVHVPEGAVPKDGPSAGIAIGVSIASALTGIIVGNDIAMTGEITLRGRVLPVGGIKEKLLAAHRERIKKVIIPAENLPYVKELPEFVREEMEIIPVEHMDEVIKITLGKEVVKPIVVNSEDNNIYLR